MAAPPLQGENYEEVAFDDSRSFIGPQRTRIVRFRLRRIFVFLFLPHCPSLDLRRGTPVLCTFSYHNIFLIKSPDCPYGLTGLIGDFLFCEDFSRPSPFFSLLPLSSLTPPYFVLKIVSISSYLHFST